MFKSLTVYQLTVPGVTLSLCLAGKLEGKPFVHCPPSFPMSRGWVPPIEGGEEMLYSVHGASLFCLRTDTKIVPASAVREALELKRVAAERAGETFTSTDERLYKEAITEGFLPGIPPTTKLTYAYIDNILGLLFLGANGAAADEFVTLMKATLNAPVPAVLLGISADPCTYYTRWAMEPALPPYNFKLGTRWSLQNLEEEGGIINLQNEEVDSPEMRALIKDGRQVCSITLRNDDIEFRLTSQLGLRNIKVQDSDSKRSMADEFAYFVTCMRNAMGDLDPVLGGWVKQEMIDWSVDGQQEMLNLTKQGEAP